MPPSSPHNLDLYRLAVQHPLAEVAFLARVHQHYRNRTRLKTSRATAPASRLREDFAGTAAVAQTWVAMDENHRALAIEKHLPTLRWARKRVREELGDRAEDLIFLAGDVMQWAPPTTPKVDLVAALNFSLFIYHRPGELLGYLKHARRCLAGGGVLVVDAFGGPGAMRAGIQKRMVRPDPCEGIAAFEYQWEQRSYNAVNNRLDCRIHFDLGPAGKRKNAFVYDWRLWTLAELTDAMLEAGFVRAQVWGQGAGPQYQPLDGMPSTENWVAYVVGLAP